MTPWVYDGDLTAAHALWVGQLTIKKFKSPPLPHVVSGGGVGVHIDKCITCYCAALLAVPAATLRRVIVQWQWVVCFVEYKIQCASYGKMVAVFLFSARPEKIWSMLHGLAHKYQPEVIHY